MDCSRGEGRLARARTGWARVRARPVVAIGPPGRRLPRGIRQSLEPEQSSRRRVVLAAGRWELSMIYNGVRRPELTGAALGAFPAASRLAGTYLARWARSPGAGGLLELTAACRATCRSARINQRADVGELAAVPRGPPARLVPLRAACGRYVDWYTLGSERPPLPRRLRLAFRRRGRLHDHRQELRAVRARAGALARRAPSRVAAASRW